MIIIRRIYQEEVHYLHDHLDKWDPLHLIGQSHDQNHQNINPFLHNRILKRIRV
jgi:hypothetical protein